MYHTICCGEIGIMYGWGIFDGRDHPITMRRPEFETSPNIKTVGLMIKLTRALWRTGKEVITDSDLYVLKGLLKKKEEGGLWKCIDKKEALLA